MRFAYADPPYLGKSLFNAEHHYTAHHVDAKAYDEAIAHVNLIMRLRDQYDGWALSTSSVALEEMLHICRREMGIGSVRIGAWVKPFASFKPGVNPAYTWEPVIYYGARSWTDRGGKASPTVRDFVKAAPEDVADCVSANITLKKGLSGAKPEPFCRWVIDLLGLEPTDTLDDLYPGTGIVTRVWEQWKLERAA